MLIELIFALAAVAVGCGLFYGGRWYERARQTAAWMDGYMDAAGGPANELFSALRADAERPDHRIH